MEEFITGSNVAKISDAGDRCFEEGLYPAAKILYTHVNNSAKLAICLVKMKMFQEAINAANTANAMQTWKEVCFACVEEGEFRLAQLAGLNIIVYMDQLKDVIAHYENLGHFNELIQLMEQGINLDRAHQGIYTQLGVLYCKFKPDKVMEHVKLFWSKLVIPTLLDSCKENLHWAEAVFLYSHYDQHDNAVEVLISHSSECWKHELFKETIKQVANNEVFYKGINFYLEEHPLLLNDLCMDLHGKLDAARVVHLVKPTGALPLVTNYLVQMQRENNMDVNDALNQMYIEEENYKSLRESIELYDNFDKMEIASKLENHDVVEFRRISTHLFKVCERWDRSIELSKRDNLWQDAMETCAQSDDPELASQLLHFFVDQEEKECFAAMLFTCFDLIKPDIVLEIAWRKGLMDFAMPFMVQAMANFQDQISTIKQRLSSADDNVKQDAKEKKEAEERQAADAAAYVGATGIYNPMLAPLPLPAPGAQYQQQYQQNPQMYQQQQQQGGGAFFG